ncbi:MAG: hypothetical protein ACYDCO_15890 [Armatimonadota bacterium]
MTTCAQAPVEGTGEREGECRQGRGLMTTATSAQLLDYVGTALEVLIDCGQPCGGLFPSLIDRERHVMLGDLPPGIPGQRVGDRAHRGSNLIHDEATLKTLYALAVALTGRATRRRRTRTCGASPCTARTPPPASSRGASTASGASPRTGWATARST